LFDALEVEQEKIEKILNRRVHKEAPGTVVYIYMESENSLTK
jgi:hypothetical protein